jgi:alpha-L-fucosidase
MNDKLTAALLATVLTLLLPITSTGQAQQAPAGSLNVSGITPRWETIYEHEASPEWFQDAKFGIYFHWGVYSVPAFGNEWYPRWMHFKHRPEHEHHLQTYGPIEEFGYHDFVPMFKAEHFDPKAWVDLFEAAGARFAGPVAEHHDGYSMWDSEITPWNAMDTGPKRDILGEIAVELRKRDMKLITSFHHARNLQRPYRPTLSDKPNRLFWDSHYLPVDGWPTSSDDPRLRMLYGNMPEGEWIETVWKAKLIEVIDKYQPDIIWFDSWLDLVPDRQQLEVFDHYFRQADELGKDVVVTAKRLDLPREVGVEDFEKGRLDRLVDYSWLTDDTISNGSWCYTETMTIKELRTVLHSLIDIVSKNGVLLLNISPKADGTIPEDQQELLRGMGTWLDEFGEAIYDTRPWHVFGEGPTNVGEGRGGHFIKEPVYTGEDVRYTRSRDGSVIYAIFLGWPESGAVELGAFGGLAADMEIEEVTVISNGAEVAWRLEGAGLRLELPPEPAHDVANVVKIGLKR